MSRINLEYNMIKRLRSGGHTWKIISEVLGVSVSTLIRFSRENDLKLDKPYQTGRRMCDKCRHFFEKKDLKSNCHGEFCLECYEQSPWIKEAKYGSPTIRDSDCEV